VAQRTELALLNINRQDIVAVEIASKRKLDPIQSSFKTQPSRDT
jgi:hypothetical protein